MRKGQAAMEFLMTYGWAILVVLAAIGALAYFGVLSPDKFLPDKCTANPPFACTQYKVSAATGLVNFSLQNSAGVDITLISVNMTCSQATSIPNGTWTSSRISNGDSIAVAWAKNGGTGATALPTQCGAFSNGDKFKATYEIVYVKSGETVTHTGTGSIQVRVEA